MNEHKDSKDEHIRAVKNYYRLGGLEKMKPTEESKKAFNEMPYKLKTTPSNEDLGFNPYQE